MFFARTERAATVSELEVDATAITFLLVLFAEVVLLFFLVVRFSLEKFLKTSFDEKSFDFFVGHLATGVQVELDACIEDYGILRNHSNLLS